MSTYAYEAHRLGNGDYMLWAKPINQLAIPVPVFGRSEDGEKHALIPSEALCFAAAQEHAREHGFTVFPHHLVIRDEEPEIDDDDLFDEEEDEDER